MKIEARCEPIELILSDVDGVMTDGGVIFNNQGIETKQFFVRDGMGIKLWQRAGYRFGVITARTSHIVKVRAAELGIEILRQGFDDKFTTGRDVMNSLNLRPEQVCFIGDDLTDLRLLKSVGLGVAVADAVEEMRNAAHYVTNVGGGRGAVREKIELILKAKKRWQDVVAKYE